MAVTKEKLKGLLFLSFTIVCWVGSATLIKEIFTSIEYNKPFFVTYISDSLNFLYLFTFLVRCRKSHGKTDSAAPAATTDIYLSRDYIMLALKVSPLVFIANYLYNEGLGLTTIASCTILSNTSSIFIFLLSMPLLHTPFSFVKSLCVLVSFAGACLIGLSDHSTEGGQHVLIGDIVTLISAIMYAFYATLLKRWVPEDSKFSWFTFFALLGICVTIMGIPMCVILHVTGIETFHRPTLVIFSFLVLNGVCGTVFPDYFWARSVVLLDPLISDLGIGITIPLGMFIDYFVESNRYGFLYILGAIFILGGFVAITLYDFKISQRQNEEETLMDKSEKVEAIN